MGLGEIAAREVLVSLSKELLRGLFGLKPGRSCQPKEEKKQRFFPLHKS
jgi:hypothetical protein